MRVSINDALQMTVETLVARLEPTEAKVEELERENRELRDRVARLEGRVFLYQMPREFKR